MHYVLIDYENVQPDIASLIADFEMDVTVFIGTRQHVNRQTDSTVRLMDTRAEVIKVSCARPNALDFHLAFHLGQFVMADPTAEFEIISNDKGYDSLILQLSEKGVCIQRSPGAHQPADVKAKPHVFAPYYERENETGIAPKAAKPKVTPIHTKVDKRRETAIVSVSEMRKKIRKLRKILFNLKNVVGKKECHWHEIRVTQENIDFWENRFYKVKEKNIVPILPTAENNINKRQ